MSGDVVVVLAALGSHRFCRLSVFFSFFGLFIIMFVFTVV